jgi:bifunctional DNase/RNase
MKLIELNVKGISYSETQSGAYALILSETKGDRKLPVIIGGFEAQAIAIALEGEIKLARPLTHDLFKDFGTCFEVNIKKVIIHKLVDGVFFSNLICERDKIEKIIDARTSDAIAMALRFKAPIFIYDSIMKSAGFTSSIKTKTNVSEDNWSKKTVKDSKENKLPENIENFSISKLKNILKKLVADEEYEKAVRVRDLITKKNI